MRIDQDWAKQITPIYQITAVWYLQQIRKHQWGDLLMIEAFCDSEAISAEVTVLDPSNKAPTIVRAMGMEKVKRGKQFRAENVPAAQSGSQNHYNVLELDQDKEKEAEEQSKYETMTEMLHGMIASGSKRRKECTGQSPW
eukprot:572480-Rhodomonas_salina.2